MLKGPIAQATIRTSFVLVLRLIVQAGTLLLVAHMLGPEQFGAFAGLAALAVLIGAFSTFGTHLVLLSDASKNKQRGVEILSYAIPTTLISGSILFLLYLAICGVLFNSINIPWIVFICIGFTETILLPIYVFPSIMLLANGQIASSQLLTIFPLGLRMLSTILILFMVFEKPLEIFAYFYIGTAVFALVCLKLYDFHAWLSIKQWRLANRQELKRSAGFATLALTTLGPGELDKVLVVKLLPLGVAGLYTFASRMIGAATLPVLALLLSALPRLFRQNLNNDQRLLKWIFSTVFLYSIFLIVSIWTLAPFVERIFSDKYAGIDEILKWICFAIPGLVFRITAGSVLMTMNKPWVRAGFELCGLFILAVCSIIFSPLWGVKGMIIALICAEWSMALIGVYLIMRERIRHPDSLLQK
jgi:O-antigen/teichoic acid export membrane protein